MEHSLAREEIRNFLNQLGEYYPKKIDVFLLGGSALCFLGSPRRTVDIDCLVDPKSADLLESVEKIAAQLHIEVEIIPIDAFIPLPQNSEDRHQFVGNFGNIEVFIFDPYSIAISKIARGFDTDIQDILFLLNQGVIELDKLTLFVEDALPTAWDYDIDPNEMRTHFGVLKELYS